MHVLNHSSAMFQRLLSKSPPLAFASLAMLLPSGNPMAASKSSMPLLAALRCSRQAPLRFSRTQCLAKSPRSYSTDADAPPPLLQKLKGDLKTAMRAKDAPRLSVLRSIMSANLNASKTTSPIRTDVQLVALIRKLQKSAQDAVADAQKAARDDLVQKENEQISILEEYIAGSGVQTLGEAEIKALITQAIEAANAAGKGGKSIMGEAMKRVNAALEGKDVDRKSVAALVKELTSQ